MLKVLGVRFANRRRMTKIETLLSDAERVVLDELLDGHANRQIAKLLKLSDKTVKNHLARILKKTGCSSRLELTVLVYKAREKELKRKLRVGMNNIRR